MYLYTPDDVDRKRAHHQTVKQDADDVPTKRRGNLGELAFEQFCREYLPVEMWEWKNEDTYRASGEHHNYCSFGEGLLG